MFHGKVGTWGKVIHWTLMLYNFHFHYNFSS